MTSISHNTSKRFSRNRCSSFATLVSFDNGDRSFSVSTEMIVSDSVSSLSYHAGENGLWICGGFGFGGGVATLINPWP